MSPSPKLVEEGEGSPQPAFKTRVDSHILLYSGAWGCHSEGTHEYPRQLELEEQHPIARTTSPVQFASRTSIAGSQAVGLGISTPRPSVPKACASGSYLSLAEVETRRRNIARRGAPSSPSSSGHSTVSQCLSQDGRRSRQDTEGTQPDDEGNTELHQHTEQPVAPHFEPSYTPSQRSLASTTGAEDQEGMEPDSPHPRSNFFPGGHYTRSCEKVL